MRLPDPMDDPEPHRCRAKSKQSGQRCGQRVVPGLTVCRFHGGSAPQTLAAARRRLAEAAIPAASVLIREAASADKSGDRIRAAAEVLDRAGLGRHATLSTTTAELDDGQVARVERLVSDGAEVVAAMSREDLEAKYLAVVAALARVSVVKEAEERHLKRR